MLRRLVLVGIATVGSIGLVVASGVTAEAAPAPGPPAAVGKVTCKLGFGNGTVSPGLSILGSPGGMKINYTASTLVGTVACTSSVTSPPGVKVLGATLSGSGYYLPVSPQTKASSCANFHGTDKVGAINETINWITAGPAIAPSTVKYTGQINTVTGAVADTITLKHEPLPTMVVKGGSFVLPAMPIPLAVTVMATTLHAPGPPCTAVPQTAFKITSGVLSW
jgi:hypothetical protein